MGTEVNMEALNLTTHKDILESGLFQLCGSRYMAKMHPDIITVNEHTDWDFFCDSSDSAAYDWLMSNTNGVAVYNNENMKYGFDDLATQIFMGQDFQVIVRKDAVKYKQVMHRLDPEFYRDYLWKSGPNSCSRDQIQRIFNQMFKMV